MTADGERTAMMAMADCSIRLGGSRTGMQRVSYVVMELDLTADEHRGVWGYDVKRARRDRHEERRLVARVSERIAERTGARWPVGTCRQVLDSSDLAVG